MDREREKLLVVAGRRLDSRLAEYAINVAVRLDLEILLLFVDEEHASLDGGQLKQQVARFSAEMEKTATEFTTLAWKDSVKVTTIIDVDERKTAVSRIRKEDPGIRFIVSDDTGDRAGEEDTPYPRLQVIRPSEDNS